MFGTWITIFVVLLIIEIVTVNLVTIWFALGALTAALAALITDSLIIQTILFIAVSIIALIIINSVYHVINKKNNKMIGAIGKVTKSINKGDTGKVLINNVSYDARSKKDITKNSKIEVISTKDEILYVRELKD